MAIKNTRLHFCHLRNDISFQDSPLLAYIKLARAILLILVDKARSAPLISGNKNNDILRHVE